MTKATLQHILDEQHFVIVGSTEKLDIYGVRRSG